MIERVKKWHLESDNAPVAPLNLAVCELCGYKGYTQPLMIGRQGGTPRSYDRFCVKCKRIIECCHQGIHIGEKKRG